VSGKSVAGDGEPKEEEEDTMKPKIANQISFETFSKFVEPFVRPLGEDDLSLLETTEVGPFHAWCCCFQVLIAVLQLIAGRSLPVHDAAPRQALF